MRAESEEAERREVGDEGRARTRAWRGLVGLVANYRRMKGGMKGENARSSASSSSKNCEAAPSRRRFARQQDS
jgi:hypothetical protein